MLVPKFTSKNYILHLINANNLALQSVDMKYVPLLIKYIVTKLYRKALETVKYKETTTMDMKKYLKQAFVS